MKLAVWNNNLWGQILSKIPTILKNGIIIINYSCPISRLIKSEPLRRRARSASMNLIRSNSEDEEQIKREKLKLKRISNVSSPMSQCLIAQMSTPWLVESFKNKPSTESWIPLNLHTKNRCSIKSRNWSKQEIIRSPSSLGLTRDFQLEKLLPGVFSDVKYFDLVIFFGNYISKFWSKIIKYLGVIFFRKKMIFFGLKYAC